MENKATGRLIRSAFLIIIVSVVLFVAYQIIKGKPIEVGLFKANHISSDTSKRKIDTPIINKNTELNIKENNGDIIIK